MYKVSERHEASATTFCVVRRSARICVLYDASKVLISAERNTPGIIVYQVRRQAPCEESYGE